MTLQLVEFKDIKPEGKYIFRSDDFEIKLDITDGNQTIEDILEYFNMDEDDVEKYGGSIEAFQACEERMSDGWNYLEVYEVIS
jgi:hypothetical protein